MTKRDRREKESAAILTIGHSNRSIEDFMRLLQAHAVTRVVDVRTVPRSRHNPQFNKDSLPASLKKKRIAYTHLPCLGGLRHTTKASANLGWRNASFCGFADYMQTAEFERAIEKLIRLTKSNRVAVMCAEAVPWRCHRSLIADALLVRGIPVEHIMSLARRSVHTLTPFAKVRGSRLVYPACDANENQGELAEMTFIRPSEKLPASSGSRSEKQLCSRETRR